MEKKGKNKPGSQQGGITDKEDKNAGSSAFNQGSEQDPEYNDGADHDPNNPMSPIPKKENPKDGNIGKNNAGGYK